MEIRTHDESPDPDLTTPQNIMLGRVANGAMPDNAALAAGVKDWRTDAPFAALVTQAHATCICNSEQRAYDLILNNKPIPTGFNFYLQAFCGWRTKYAEDGFAQDVSITIQAVDGYSRDGHTEDGKRPPVRKYKAGMRYDT